MILTSDKRRQGRAWGRSLLIALGLSALGAMAAAPGFAQTADDGEAIFNSVCFACHTVGEGRRVGPDLAGIREKRSDSWLIPFIQSSQSMIESGDAEAVAIFEEYSRIPMPDNALSEAQVRSVLVYIDERERAALTPVEPAADPPLAAPTEVTASEPPAEALDPQDIRRGQELFQGTTRFANLGAACNSCHHVRNDAVIGGGVLARELTSTFSVMGEDGVRAILGQPPFPVMTQAYRGKPLTDDEIHALVAFLRHADEQQAFQQPRDYGIRLAGTGAVGAAILLGFYALAFRGRKRASVNQKIYDRQIRSE